MPSGAANRKGGRHLSRRRTRRLSQRWTRKPHRSTCSAPWPDSEWRVAAVRRACSWVVSPCRRGRRGGRNVRLPAGKAPRSHGRLARGNAALRGWPETMPLDHREPDIERFQIFPNLGPVLLQLGLSRLHFPAQLRSNRLRRPPDLGLARSQPGLHHPEILARFSPTQPRVPARASRYDGGRRRDSPRRMRTSLTRE